MKFAFVYDKAEGSGQAKDSPPAPDDSEPHARRLPPPAVRIALAARVARTQGLLDFDRAHAGLNRLLYTVSTLEPDPDPVMAPDEFGQDELFRPQAFRDPTPAGGA